MPKLLIHQSRVTPELAKRLVAACPFGALEYYETGVLGLNGGCKLCKLCVKQSDGAIEYVDSSAPAADKSMWRGVAVFADYTRGRLHPVTLELLGKARSLANVSGERVISVIIGSGAAEQAKVLAEYGAERVYIYDDPALADFTVEPYAACFSDFIRRAKPGSILVGATQLGRSLAPRVAARFRTGLTADCTRLEMTESGDLRQIRPAFGGNIMAEITTPRHRPQFCTVRYKIFDRPSPSDNPDCEFIRVPVLPAMLASGTRVLEVSEKPKEVDISDAEIIVAAGRGLKSKDDLPLLQSLADSLGGVLAGTRPTIEAGWLDPRRQIGLSGRTVKPKLIITAGVSGSVQFAAGMRGSDLIVSINSDPHANIFDIAHVGLVGDLYDVVPKLIDEIGGVRNV